LKDDAGNESEVLSFTITKKNTLTEGLVAHYEFEGNAMIVVVMAIMVQNMVELVILMVLLVRLVVLMEMIKL
jgi:hypothetical protein